ncbi:MAG: VOC family protein [Myxococcales bacterium]|nr:VOC family protein [Myxococcales bacterium]
MTELTTPVVDTFCWVELATSDPTAAKTFYAAAFGWELADMDMPSGKYTMATVGGKTVCGMMLLPDEAKKMGAPPHWLSYVATNDVAASLTKVASLGGKTLAGPMDIGPGTMAVVQDPSGGVFAFWQAKQSMGTWLYQEPNALCWNELLSTNVDAAGKFYATLFGWKPEAMPMPEGAYTVFKRGDSGVAGMMAMPPMAGGAPRAWLPYFQVQNADAFLAKAIGLGAQIRVPPQDVPKVGRFAALVDPQGAVFAVLQPAM